VIISITGGEDMRLMEVDEAANHIKELVDPDANIIWGSAFNNDLEGKIRVSVVATGIEADVSNMPEPAKLFTFPPSRKAAEPAAAAPAAPVETPAPAPTESKADDLSAEAADLLAPEPETAGEELVLGEDDVLSPVVGGNPLPPRVEEPEAIEPPAAGTRRWLTGDAEGNRPAPAREGGTLFERMSNIARGAAKAQVEEEAPAPRTRDPLEIPRFLNRQNNQ
jgi:cell division protein FtsZ